MEEKYKNAVGSEEDIELQKLELQQYVQEKERAIMEIEQQLQLQKISLMQRETQQEEEQEGYYGKLRGEQSLLTSRMQVSKDYTKKQVLHKSQQKVQS